MEISAVILTLNDESRLESALKSLEGIAAEIIVVDGGSSDNTLKIAGKYASCVHQRACADRAAQQNFAEGQASFPWILSLGPDEMISSGLRDELVELRAGSPECAAFSAPRRAFYLGRWIRHSDRAPDRRPLLFRKEQARWENGKAGERLRVDGPTKRLRGPLHYFTFATISEHAAWVNRDSGLAAHKLYAGKKEARFFRLLIAPIAPFLKTSVLRLGFLDGFPGLVIACLNGYSAFLRSAQLREIWKKGERIEPFPD